MAFAAAGKAVPESDVRTYNPNTNDDEEAQLLQQQLLTNIEKIENNEPTMVHLNINNSVYVGARESTARNKARPAPPLTSSLKPHTLPGT